MVVEQGTTNAVDMSPTSGYGTDHTLTKTVTLKYTHGSGSTAITDSIDYQIKIINDIKSIAIHTSPKTAYNIGDSFTLQTTSGTDG